MANNTYSTPVINNFDAIKGDTNSPDTLSTEIKHGIQSPLLSTAQHFYKEVKPHYNLREPKGDKPTMVYFVCFINKKQVRISTGYKVYPKQWNKIQAITSSLLSGLDNANNTILNNKIDEMNVRFTEYINYICNNNTELNSNTLKRYIMNRKIDEPKEARIDIAKVLRTYLSKDTSIKDGTKDNNLRFITKFESYLSTLDIKGYEDITLEVMKGFQQWCIDNVKGKAGERASSASINKIVECTYKLMKKYLVNNGLMKGSQYADIEIEPLKEKAIDDEIALRDDELTMLYNYQCTTKEDEDIKNLFLMECTTGQRFSDIEKVDKLIERKDGRTYINLVQDKAGTKVQVDIIFQMALDILAKYNYQLPTINKKKFNTRIKEIAKQAGVKGVEEQRYEQAGIAGVQVTKKERYNCVSSHTGRRTFITLLSLRGMPDSEIARYSGHNTLSMVRLYDKSKTGTKEKVMYDRLVKERPDLILKMVGEEPVKIDDTNNIAYQFGKAFSKLEDEHKEDIKKVSFNKEVDKTFSIINNDIDTTDFLLTNGVNEKDIIELMKHKEMMSEDVEVTYDKNGKAVIKFK